MLSLSPYTATVCNPLCSLIQTLHRFGQRQGILVNMVASDSMIAAAQMVSVKPSFHQALPLTKVLQSSALIFHWNNSHLWPICIFQF